uniref:Putative nuclease HARBI1 n=1 Tax=Scophthalmus maximus TaxID=52904 RepID=A0A8D3APF9_SCOMX
MAIPIAILDCDLLLHGRGHKTLDRFDLDSVSDTILLTQFGFPREFILYLVELLRDDLCRRTLRSRAISPEVQVLAALGFYTSGSFQTSMGDTIGISQASMSRCVSNVTKALVEKAPQFITFNRYKLELTFQEFQRVAGFPGVLGVLDCVQVAIKAPNSEDSSYVNKKGFHSVACQLVCDARGLLLSAETHWPGGLKDTDVLERSALHKQLQDFEKETETHSGDCRYPLRKWLMTPVYSPESPAEFRYNLAHTATHEIVDRTFRAIQTRFRCLDGTKGYLMLQRGVRPSCWPAVSSTMPPCSRD